nr:uncharacterized protein DDB_G0287625 [Ziziphus jujuba var. spinosa]
MGKTSSSHRKKRSKKGIQARMKKKNKNRRRRYESKKLRRHDDSDDDSRTSVSVSSYSSSSEDDNRRGKRARSRTRKDVIGKKRTRNRSSSPESSEDSPHLGKRKRSKKKYDYEAKKKIHAKKKPRRYASDSSTSSRSLSCSTCSDRSISSHEIETKRYTSRHRKDERHKRNLEEVKIRSKRSRYRSRSRSLCSCSESSDYQSDQKVLGENTFRRLRSVITVTEKDNEGSELNRDEHKEEIIYFNDDYPSCRSNDSNEGGSKREGDYYSHVGSEKDLGLENVQGDEAVVSDVRISKVENHGEGQYNGSIPACDELQINHPVNEKVSEVSGAISSQSGDDLESLLRQRALENLKRYRGGLQTIEKTAANQKNKNYGDVNHSSSLKPESVQNKFLKTDGPRLVGAKSSKEDDAEVVGSNKTKLVKVIRVPTVGKDVACSSQNDENVLDGNTGGNESLSVSAKQNIGHPTEQMTISGNPNEKVKSTGTVQPKLATAVVVRHSSKTHSTIQQALVSQEHPGGKVLVSKSSPDETAAKTAPTVNRSNNNNGLDVNNTSGSGVPEPSTCLNSATGENRSDIMQDEVKDGSQFEQKTMSVMRGGEMVQVSYKVYIPKKAPALARRQLKR